MKEVNIIKVENGLRSAIEAAVKPLGGFESIVQAGERVLLKPNFNTADPFPASTDLAFLRAVTEMVLEQGPGQLIIGDSSTMALKTEKVMEQIGVYGLEALSPAVKVVNFDKGTWVKKSIPQARYLKTVKVPALLDEVDKLILLPCLKTHFKAQFTGSIKLTVACMHPRQRPRLHMRNLQGKVAELSSLFQPDLVIMDARKCFITKGPSSGEVREPGLILASTDRINLDIEGIKIIQGYPGNTLDGIEPASIPHIKRVLEMSLEAAPV